jgi:hypothetical protein
MTSILCIIDFSKSSKQILMQACKLAKQLKYHLTVLYCYRLNGISTGLIADIKKIKEREALQQFTAWESEFIKGFEIEYDFRSEVGFLIHRVEDYLKREHAGFLMMDKNMKRDNTETFRELLGQTSVPIILITTGDSLNPKNSSLSLV